MTALAMQTKVAKYHLKELVKEFLDMGLSLRDTVKLFEKHFIKQVIVKEGSRRAAYRRLQVHRNTFALKLPNTKPYERKFNQ